MSDDLFSAYTNKKKHKQTKKLNECSFKILSNFFKNKIKLFLIFTQMESEFSQFHKRSQRCPLLIMSTTLLKLVDEATREGDAAEEVHYHQTL